MQLGITDAGRTLIDEAFTTNLNVYQTMLKGLTPAEATELEALLERLLGRLDELVVIGQPWETPTALSPADPTPTSGPALG